MITRSYSIAIYKSTFPKYGLKFHSKNPTKTHWWNTQMIVSMCVKAVKAIRFIIQINSKKKRCYKKIYNNQNLHKMIITYILYWMCLSLKGALGYNEYIWICIV